MAGTHELGPLDRAAAEDYGRRLLHGGSFMTRLSHRSRVDTAVSLLDGVRVERGVDVGAADGWFLRALLAHGVIREGMAVDSEAAMLDAGRARSAGLPLRFVGHTDSALAQEKATFGLVSCLETLEHVDDVEAVLDQMTTLAKPGGILFVSVPVEVGPSLAGKQAGRWLANRKGGYSYERYPWRELARAAILWDTDGITRQNLASHKGFDYRRVRRLLAGRATIERTVYSPVTWLGPVVASTVFWLARA